MKGNRDYALGRLKSGVLNRTEQAYADHLETLRRAGSILWFEFEGVCRSYFGPTKKDDAFVYALMKGKAEKWLK